MIGVGKRTKQTSFVMSLGMHLKSEIRNEQIKIVLQIIKVQCRKISQIKI